MRKPNYDNVFLSTDGLASGWTVLKAMDHTHCFTYGRDFTPSIAKIDRVKDERPYGLFRAFLPYLSHDGILNALGRLAGISLEQIKSTVAAVPNKWQVSSEARAGLFDLINRRKDYVLENGLEILNLDGQ